MKTMEVLVLAATLAGCATPSVSQFQGPDGAAVKTAKCSSDTSKCFAAATQSCPGAGTYRVVGSASRAGGLLADLIPGPVTWYYMSYVCGPSDGKMPEFAFTGQQYAPPITTNCIADGNRTSCVAQ